MKSAISLNMAVILAVAVFSARGIYGADSVGAPAGGVSAASYGSIQQAIDANPGRMILIPDGDHVITKKLRIAGDSGGLCGYGRIIQSNPAETILEIEHASNVRVTGVTLTRAEGRMDATAPGVFCYDSRNVVLDSVRVVDSRARNAAIEIRESQSCTVRDCEVLNYKRVAVDDRTDSPEHYGYAFICIDGTGILVSDSVGTMLRGNRVVERNLFPTREMKETHKLGTLTEGRFPSKLGKLAAGAFKNNYVGNWHQGSAIVVTSPEKTRNTVVSGNYIENAAQGIDLHCDNCVCSDNVVVCGMMGVKATHGSRNLIISGNMLTRIDLWGILLNPGTASHNAEAPAGDKPAREANVDGGIIIANNIITEYGCGNEYWNWGGATDDQGGSFPITFRGGQLETNPPLTDVIIQGNVVYDTNRDGVVVDGKVGQPKPKYQYAVFVGSWGAKDDPTLPRNLHFIGNVFHPGSRGVSNVELNP
ncbi:MAG TPA: hypothetical protein PL033_04255 [Candidatus Brocadiia bacterium]|nr:hypothetical protein [Candidatus Brocadiia bacterium]